MTKTTKDRPMMEKVGRPRLVYLIHLDRPLNPDHPQLPQHYIGSAVMGRLAERFAEHKSGVRKLHYSNGRPIHTGASAFLAAAVERGIPFRIVRVWVDESGFYDGEYGLKALKAAPKLCPCCSDIPRNPSFMPWEVPVEEALAMKRTTVIMRERRLAATQAAVCEIN